MSEHTSFLDPFLHAFWHAATQPWFTYLWCGGTVVWAIFWAIRLRWETAGIRRQIDEATRELRKVKGEKGFAEAFREYDQKVRSLTRLRHAWRQFSKSLVIEGQSSIRCARDPSDYINHASLISPNIGERFYGALPGQLTALGILGTFVGLSAGVYLSRSALENAGGDITRTLESLGGLLGGASLAFLTSVAGLVSSVLFLPWQRREFRNLDRALDTWVEAIEARLGVETAEGVGLRQLDESRKQTLHLESHLKELREQTTQLKTFNTELVFSIQRALEEQIAVTVTGELAKVTAAVDRVSTAVIQMRTEMGRADQAFVQQVVGQLGSNITEARSTELKARAQSMQQLQEKLDTALHRLHDVPTLLEQRSAGLEETLRRGGNQLTNQLDVASEQLVQSLTNASEGMTRSLTDAGARVASGLGEAVDRLAQSMAQQGEMAATSTAQMMAMASVLDRLSGIVITFEEVHRGLGGAVEPLREVARTLEKAGLAMEKGLENTAASAERIETATGSLQAAQEDTKEVWAGYQTRFTQVDESLERVFEQIEEGLGRYMEMIRDFSNELDSQTARAVQGLVSAGSELKEAVEDLGEVADKLVKGMEGLRDG